MKILAIACVLALVSLGGCSFSKEDRIEAARAAVILATERLSAPVVEVLVEEGIDPETAKKVGEIVVRRARAIADKIVSKLED